MLLDEAKDLQIVSEGQLDKMWWSSPNKPIILLILLDILFIYLGSPA